MIHGVLNIYKEAGYTSHDVVACLRRIVGQKKIGHTGTLDPDAEGVLPVCLGKATKLCDMLTDRDKVYEAVLLLGKSTDTQDISGKVLQETDVSSVMPEQAEECILSFLGEYEQIPPMYSAVKVNGRKLYELAREGRTVERKSRKVTIHSLRILKLELPRVWMEVCCSKGTYIRTLCSDIGDKLGVGGCMEKLVRTRSGQFSIDNSIKLDDVRRLSGEGRLDEALVPIDEIFHDMRRISLDDRTSFVVRNGGHFPLSDFGEEGFLHGQQCRVYDSDGRFLAIYRFDGEHGMFRLVKMFYYENEE